MPDRVVAAENQPCAGDSPLEIMGTCEPIPCGAEKLDVRWPAIHFLAAVLFLACCYGIARTMYESSGIPNWWYVAGLTLLAIPSAAPLVFAPGERMDSRRRWQCLFPPLKLGARDPFTGERIWIPCLGWTLADARLFERIEQFVTLFLIGAGVLMGSLTGYVLWNGGGFADLAALPAYQIGMLVIWLVIVIELILLESMARMKRRFYNSHRVNLVVALTPMLPLLRAALLVRIVRGAFQFETFQRVIHGGRRNRLAVLELELMEKQEELERLREKIRIERETLARENGYQLGQQALSSRDEPQEHGDGTKQIASDVRQSGD